MADRASRTEQRQGFTVDQRVQLVEHDLDENDDAVRELTAAVRRLTGVLVGAIISFATSAMVLAFTIGVHH